MATACAAFSNPGERGFSNAARIASDFSLTPPSEPHQRPSASTLRPFGVPRSPDPAARRFVQATFLIGVAMRKVLSVCRAAGLDATCCSFPRPVLPINISVPAHAARHYGEFASAKPDSSAAAGVASLVVNSVIVDHPKTTSIMSPRIELAVLEE